MTKRTMNNNNPWRSASVMDHGDKRQSAELMQLYINTSRDKIDFNTEFNTKTRIANLVNARLTV